MTLNELATAIAAKANQPRQGASAGALAHLRDLGVPGSVTAFYELFEPANVVEFKQVRIWPIPEVIQENRAYVPGADLHPQGYIVVATTEYGDTYCLDLHEPGPPVVIMTHEITFEGMAAEEIRRYRKRVALDFTDFLQRFLDEQLDVTPLYDPVS